MAKKKAAARRAPAKRDTVRPLNSNGSEHGAPVDRAKLEAVRAAVRKAVPRSSDGIAFRDLPEAVGRHLEGGAVPGGGALMWWVTTAKLDLEGRGEIERVPGVSPQRLRRVRSN